MYGLVIGSTIIDSFPEKKAVGCSRKFLAEVLQLPFNVDEHCGSLTLT
jgi:hypothetical protein